uniref:Uncharacterized protein n=1 Tax=Rhizophora mucronata TaxID=61149 RepID=A0A2P2N0L6_RHIMU
MFKNLMNISIFLLLWKGRYSYI